MQVVVTGAQGQLGSELCRQLGGDAIGLDMPEFDLTDDVAVRSLLRQVRPHAVVNTAAFTQVDRAESEVQQCRAVNATAVTTLARVCEELDCVLMQLSTDYVFGGQPDRSAAYRETDEPCPQSVYARTKWEGEQAALAWAKSFVVRTCGLYGPAAARSSGNFVETMLRLGKTRGHVRVVADQRCTPSYTTHVARAICFLLTTDSHGVYHLVNSGQTTWYDFAVETFRVAGMDVGVEAISSKEYGAPAPRPAYSVLDNCKYHSLSNAPPMPHWTEALAEYLRSRG